MAVGYEPTTSWSRGVCSVAVLKPLLPPCSYFVLELTAPVSENLESCGSCGQFKNDHDQCPKLTHVFFCVLEWRGSLRGRRPSGQPRVDDRVPEPQVGGRLTSWSETKESGQASRSGQPILTNESVLMLKLNVLNISLFLLQNFCIFSRRFILEHKMALLTGSNLTLKAGMGSILIASQFWRHFVQPPDAGKAYPDLLKKVNAKYFRCCA